MTLSLKNKPKMSLITFSITTHYKEILDAFVNKGVVPSRSSAIRMALSYGIPLMQDMIENQEDLIDNSRVSSLNNNLLPKDTIFVELKKGKFQKYKLVGGNGKHVSD